MTEISFPLDLPIDVVAIQKILPHRYPFLLVDRVLSLSGGSQEDRKGRKIKAIKNITVNENCFTGHFPDHPIFPGVLTIESLAQASALCAYIPDRAAARIYIASIQDAKFRSPVVPGDTLVLHSECTKDRGSIVVFKTKAEVDGQIVAEAELWAKIF